jgi:putative ABC transport system permease protein
MRPISRFPLALRPLLRSRNSCLSAAAILALGIAMSASMFSLVDAVLLRPLPFPRQQSIDVIWKSQPLAGPQVGELAFPELRDLQENIAAFESVAVLPTSLYGYGRVLQTGNAEPVEIESAPVSHDFFRVLGVAPAIGRDFRPSDERVGAAPVVILSDRVWREHLGGDPNIIGRLLRLNGQGHTVIGVMAPGIEFPRGAGIWIPLGVDPRIVERRGATFLQAIARLKPGQTRDAVTHALDALFQRLARDHPEVYPPVQQAVVTPLPEFWTGSARIHLWIMMAASLLLLVASIISAGNLLLSRTVARRAELATRMAVGASRAQIVAQLAAEALLIAIAAVSIGLIIAEWLVRFLVRRAPGDIPRLSEASLDLRAFVFAAAAAALAALAFTLIPGWLATQTHLDFALREAASRLSIARTSRRTQSLFLAAQAALTVMLLATAALLVLSYRSMLMTDIGFANRDAVSMNLALRGPGVLSGQAFDAESRRAFSTRLLNRLRGAPGVTSAAAILLRPLEGAIGWDESFEFEFEAGTKDSRALPKANYEVVTPGYFRTVGTPILEGRDFDEHDTEDGEPVVIISRALAEHIRAAGRAPLGLRVRVGGSRWSKIVGVCSDARYRSVVQTGPDIFVPYLQAQPPTNYIVIRGTRPAQELAALVRRMLAALDPAQAVSGVATIGELIDRNTARHRFNMILLLWFGICAAILAASGIHSVIAGTTVLRRTEIAIKTALGARRPRLVRDVALRALVFVVAGEAIGIGSMALAAPLLANVLYSVSPRDPVVLVSAALFLFAVSLAAAARPAWIACGGNPVRALRGR